MARRKGSEHPSQPQVPPEEGIELLQVQLTQGHALLTSRPIPSHDYTAWELATRKVLEQSFGTSSGYGPSVTAVGKMGPFPMSADAAWWENHRATSLQIQLKTLEHMIETLQHEVQRAQEGRCSQSVARPVQFLDFKGLRKLTEPGDKGTRRISTLSGKEQSIRSDTGTTEARGSVVHREHAASLEGDWMTAKVLVVDDEKVVCNIFAEILRLDGYEVMTTTDGLQVMDILRREPLDVVLMDMHMPTIT